MKLFSWLAFALSIAIVAGCASNHDLSLNTSNPRIETCKATTEGEIAALFDRWNQSLQTGDPHKVVSNYAERSILLLTVSNKPRRTPAEKEDYFHHSLENRPSRKIDLRRIELGCNTAIDAGLYKFTYAKTGEVIKGRYTFTYRWDGSNWLISSHHSSMMPENPRKLRATGQRRISPTVCRSRPQKLTPSHSRSDFNDEFDVRCL